MPEYTYRVRDRQGRTGEGTHRADNIGEAVEYLHRRKYTILDIREQAGLSALLNLIKNTGKQKVRSRDYMVFCRHFAAMTNAGFTILKSLKLLGGQSENRVLADAVLKVSLDVEKGSTLAESMEGIPDVFPPVMTGMIAAGEAGGIPGEVFERLALHYERQNDFEEKIRSAMIYPAVICVVAFVVLGIMLIYVLPAFGGMFRNMQAEVPAITMAVMGFSALLTDYWFVFVSILICVYAGARIFFNTEQGKLLLDRLKLKLPVYSTIYRKTVVSRFSRTLGSLLNSGVDILVALDLAAKLVDNRVFSGVIGEAGKGVSDGYTMAGMLKMSGLFPPMAVEMIRVGEESGCLDDMLDNSAEIYEREVAHSIDRLALIIEPAVLIFVGVFVGFLVASLVIPMFQIYELI